MPDENAKDIRWGLVAGGGYEIAIGGIKLAPEISYDFGLSDANTGNKSKFSSLALSVALLF
ncbi:hypothetical protein L0337_29750 [candidate division KSB1 bacterium]|nr:hypothetical protein [candidate division KSB1 bacterium]